MFNNMLAVLGRLITVLELVAYVALVALSYHSFKVLYFAGKNIIQTRSDTLLRSCFIVAVCVAIFPISSDIVRDYILALDMEKMALRQLFYLSMFVMECGFMFALVAFHWIGGCALSPLARVNLVLSVLICSVEATQFVARGIYGFDGLMPFYKTTVLTLHAATLFSTSAYPFAHFWRYNRQV